MRYDWPKDLVEAGRAVGSKQNPRGLLSCEGGLGDRTGQRKPSHWWRTGSSGGLTGPKKDELTAR